jgi:hypothetical protein
MDRLGDSRSDLAGTSVRTERRYQQSGFDEDSLDARDVLARSIPPRHHGRSLTFADKSIQEHTFHT